MDRMVVAKRAIERCLAAGGSGNGLNPTARIFARRLRAEQERLLDGEEEVAQTIIA
jgi:hypothetical protein